MIFAIETEEQTLHVFENENAAIAYCEGIDVEAEIWLFWNAEGSPLEPEFTVPNKSGLFTVQNGKYKNLYFNTCLFFLCDSKESFIALYIKKIIPTSFTEQRLIR